MNPSGAGGGAARTSDCRILLAGVVNHQPTRGAPAAAGRVKSITLRADFLFQRQASPFATRNSRPGSSPPHRTSSQTHLALGGVPDRFPISDPAHLKYMSAASTMAAYDGRGGATGIGFSTWQVGHAVRRHSRGAGSGAARPAAKQCCSTALMENNRVTKPVVQCDLLVLAQLSVTSPH